MNMAHQNTLQVCSASIVTTRPRETSWADLISTYIGGSHITEAVGHDGGFFGQLTNWRFGELRFVLSKVRGVSVRGRQTTDESMHNPRDVWLCMCLSGSFELDADRRSTIVSPNSMAVMNSGRPHVVTFAPDCDVLWVRAPRYHFSSLDRSSGIVVLDTSRGVGKIALQSLQGIYDQAKQLDDKHPSQIVCSALGLVSAAIQQADARGPFCERSELSQLERLKQFIENNLHDESFSLQTAASALGKNPRYLNRVFEAEGSSFMRWTWNRRLERAQLTLATSQQECSITEVAFNCGFKNLSHFSRAFRERFGHPPSVMLQRPRRATRH
jgi:AraC-like DNA-binding protein